MTKLFHVKYEVPFKAHKFYKTYYNKESVSNYGFGIEPSWLRKTYCQILPLRLNIAQSLLHKFMKTKTAM